MSLNTIPSEHDSPTVRLIECPRCEAAQEVSPTTVVLPDSTELQSLFAGALNRVCCDSCGQEFVLDVPILYRDDQSRFMVYLLPLDDPADWQSSEETMSDLADDVFADLPGVEPPECRLVRDRRSLIEKIALHQRGLDDRMVEYVKYQLANNPNEQNRIDLVRHELFFDFSADLSRNLSFLVFDRESGEAVAGAHIPIDVYRDVEETFRTNESMRDELNDLFPGCYVSLDRLLM